MKKLLSICFLLVAIFLTGCEKNRLVCKYTDEEIKNLKSETKYIFSFNGETVKSATMTTKVTLSGDYNNQSFIDNYTTIASSAASEYNSTEGVTATVTNNKNIVTLKVEMEPAKMAAEDVETYGLNLSKDELKLELEESGYTCK